MIKDALNSVWAQTYRPIELIVVDDGSTDKTEAMVMEWRAKHVEDDTFVLTLIKQHNKGANVARNSGLIASHGEYIQFLDSDDLFHPEKTRLQINALEAFSLVGYVWSPLLRTTTAITTNVQYRHTVDDTSLVFPSDPNQVPIQAVLGMYRRSVNVIIGPWNETLSRHQDLEYITRMLAFGTLTCCVPTPLYTARIHNTGQIRDLRKDNSYVLSSNLAAGYCAEVFLNAGIARSGPCKRIAHLYIRTMLLALRCRDYNAYEKARYGAYRMTHTNKILNITVRLFHLFKVLGGSRLVIGIYLIARSLIGPHGLLRFRRRTRYSK